MTKLDKFMHKFVYSVRFVGMKLHNLVILQAT